jgi:hypothetical protein
MVKRKRLADETANENTEPKLPADMTKAKPLAEISRHATFAAANLMATSPGRLLEDQQLKIKLAQDSAELYAGLKPRNAQESLMCMLAVGVTNASLDCLAQASNLNVQQFQLRDLNLRHGTVAAESSKP